MLRPIYLAQLDKKRPVLILTRALVFPTRRQVTVAPISSTIRGLASEVPLNQANGLDKPSVIQCDNVTTIETAELDRIIGYLLDWQEPLLTAAITAAYDLRT